MNLSSNLLRHKGKSDERKAQKVLLCYFWQWSPTISDASTRRQVIVVGSDVSNLARVAVVLSTKPESDKEATPGTEKPILMTDTNCDLEPEKLKVVLENFLVQ